MDKIHSVLKIQAAKLDEDFIFQADRFQHFELSDEEADAVLERAFEEFNFGAENGTLLDLAHRLLTLTMKETYVANNSDDPAEIIEALCNGITLVGMLIGIPAAACEQNVCSSCIEKNYASNLSRLAANALHDRPNGTRSKRKQIQEIWASGKYTSRDICAEQECASLEMSFSTARKALRGLPDPS